MGLKILIVNDDCEMRRLLDTILQEQGYRCTLAENTAAARTCLAQERFALVLCGICTPGESGLDLMHFVLQNCPDTAGILISAAGDEDILEEAIDVGIYACIVNPFGSGELLIAVANALRERSLRMRNRKWRTGSTEATLERAESAQ